MTHREQLAILALLIVLVLLAILVPRQAAGDVPVVAGPIPAAEFRTLTPTALRAPAPSIAPSASPLPPAATPVSRHPVGRQSASSGATPATGSTASSKTGIASWFRSPIGVSAAGPALRAAFGPGWRGMRVHVTGPAGSADVVLGDWMRADRLIDLDDDAFRAVCGPLSKGICRVEVAP